jgi:hypothetical protein
VFNVEHRFSSFLPAGENVLFEELFSRFLSLSFSFYRVVVTKPEEKTEEKSVRSGEKIAGKT